MADFCSKQESDVQSLQNCSNLAGGSSSRCGRSPAKGTWALLCDGSEGPAQPRCQAEMCHVPAVRWSWRKRHCLSRERLLSSLCGCCASVRAGNGSPFNTLMLLLMPSLSLSQNRWLAMGQRIPQWDGHIWKGEAGLVELVEESCVVPTSWSCGKSDKLH